MNYLPLNNGISLPPNDQIITGVGSPRATHLRVTDDPGLTFCDRGASVIKGGELLMIPS
jgi:hypothetical protein